MSTDKKLWDYEHPYYCTAYDTSELDSWKQFIEEWSDADPDLNLLFRFDFLDKKHIEYDYPLKENEGVIRLFYVAQRKGFLFSVDVRVQESDLSAIKAFLTEKLAYLKTMWQPIG